MIRIIGKLYPGKHGDAVQPFPAKSIEITGNCHYNDYYMRVSDEGDTQFLYRSGQVISFYSINYDKYHIDEAINKGFVKVIELPDGWGLT